MTPKNFVIQIRKAIVEENVAIYRDLFESTEVDSASDPYWVRALSLYATLGAEQREALFEIMRQVIVDTISNVFAILDGVSELEDQEEEFSLFAGNGTEQLNGELQDIFLELEEDESHV